MELCAFSRANPGGAVASGTTPWWSGGHERNTGRLPMYPSEQLGWRGSDLRRCGGTGARNSSFNDF